jgi:hypothetical protein
MVTMLLKKIVMLGVQASEVNRWRDDGENEPFARCSSAALLVFVSRKKGEPEYPRRLNFYSALFFFTGRQTEQKTTALD